MEPVWSTTVLPSVRLMLSLRLMPMLSTELDTPLPLLLLLVDTRMPPTATPRPGGCATPGLSRTPVRSPTQFVCLSLSAPACPSAPPSPSPSVTPPPGPCATPTPGRSPGLSAEPGPPPSATPSPTPLLTKCATPAPFRSAMPSPSRSPSRSLLRNAPRSPVRSATPSLTRSQGLPVLRFLSLLRPLWPTLPLLLLPPLLWPLLVTELALVPVLVLSATVLVWPLWLLLVLAMPIKSISTIITSCKIELVNKRKQYFL